MESVNVDLEGAGLLSNILLKSRESELHKKIETLKTNFKKFYEGTATSYNPEFPFGNDPAFYNPIYLVCEKLNFLAIIEKYTNDKKLKAISKEMLKTHDAYDESTSPPQDGIPDLYNYMKTLTTKNTVGYKKLTNICEGDQVKYLTFSKIPHTDFKEMPKLEIKNMDHDENKFRTILEADFKALKDHLDNINNILIFKNKEIKDRNNMRTAYTEYFNLNAVPPTSPEEASAANNNGSPVASAANGDVTASADNDMVIKVAAAVAASEHLAGGGPRKRRVIKAKN